MNNFVSWDHWGVPTEATREIFKGKLNSVLSLYIEPKDQRISVIVGGDSRRSLSFTTPPVQARKLALSGLGELTSEKSTKKEFFVHCVAPDESLDLPIGRKLKASKGVTLNELANSFALWMRLVEEVVTNLLYQCTAFSAVYKKTLRAKKLDPKMERELWNSAFSSDYRLVRQNPGEDVWMMVFKKPAWVDGKYVPFGVRRDIAIANTEAAALVSTEAFPACCFIQPVTMYGPVKSPKGGYVHGLITDSFCPNPLIKNGALVSVAGTIIIYNEEAQFGARLSLRCVDILDSSCGVVNNPFRNSSIAEFVDYSNMKEGEEEAQPKIDFEEEVVVSEEEEEEEEVESPKKIERETKEDEFRASDLESPPPKRVKTTKRVPPVSQFINGLEFQHRRRGKGRPTE